MSYCVNCGVKLDKELTGCPLCNTKIINPALSKSEHSTDSETFPHKTGQVEVVLKRDLGLLISIILGGIAISALFLNIFIFREGWWSLLIIGVCVIFFFIALPAFILTKTPIYVSLVFNALAVALYLYFISFLTADTGWLTGLALPILVFLTVIILIVVFLIKAFKPAFLTTALYLITAIGAVCVGLELLIGRYSGKEFTFLWSAIVLTVCAVIDAGLITVLSRRRLRVAIQKRLHF
ncbi:MAG: DUF6320 domain-containing protein [Lachnospiraceae bacterium]|nr:DUF6320 domain-containing protein [Lachnospiraceae bacterium]